jgi:hypothetical protein
MDDPARMREVFMFIRINKFILILLLILPVTHFLSVFSYPRIFYTEGVNHSSTIHIFNDQIIPKIITNTTYSENQENLNDMKVAIITAISSLAGVVVGSIPAYFLARANNRMEIQKQRLIWKKEYREKLLGKVEEALAKRANGVQLNPSQYMIGVFDKKLSIIMREIANSPNIQDEMIASAYQRMDELLSEID